MTAQRDPKPYAEAALAAEVEAVSRATPGHRNNLLARAAFALGGFVGSRLLAEERVSIQLVAAARAAGLAEREAADTVRRGLRDGMAKPRTAPETTRSAKPATTTAVAVAIWNEAWPVASMSQTAIYLAEARYLSSQPPASIRHHRGVLHKPTGLRFPALVAALTGPDRKIAAVQYTLLQADGRGKANVSIERWTIGPRRGAAVRLAPATDHVALVEGVEDGLALQQMTGCTCWATCGVEGLATVELPPEIARVTLAPDNDDAGRAILERAGNRFADQGRAVDVLLPPDGYGDWNDVLPGFEERAGIMEHDGGAPRAEADLAAWRDMLRGIG